MYNKFLEHLLSNDPDEVVSRKGVKKRKFRYALLRPLLILLNPYRQHIVKEGDIPKGVPKIFVATHGFKDDLLNSIIAIKEQSYFLFGNIEMLLKSIDGVLSHIFGACVVDRLDPKSRAAAVPKMERIMGFGTNILIFPEAAWNLTDAELVMKLFGGFYELAKRTGALVVPLALHVEVKNCYILKGDAFDVSGHSSAEARMITRDKLATLKYELMERYSNYSRAELEADGRPLAKHWEEYKAKLKNEPKFSVIEEIERGFAYKDKNIVSSCEAFAHLQDIKLTRDTAFLFNRRTLE